MSAPALFARTWGQGPPVVLLHGLGASSRYWETLAKASLEMSTPSGPTVMA